MTDRETVCFDCGSSVETAFENVLPDGRPCARCRQRALEALPALLPGRRAEEEAEEAREESEASAEADDEGDRPRLTLVQGHVEGPDDPVRA